MITYVCVLMNMFGCSTDIDECEEDSDGCEDTCNNTIGSFFCNCSTPGFEVGPDNTSCVGKFHDYKCIIL